MSKTIYIAPGSSPSAALYEVGGELGGFGDVDIALDAVAQTTGVDVASYQTHLPNFGSYTEAQNFFSAQMAMFDSELVDSVRDFAAQAAAQAATVFTAMAGSVVGGPFGAIWAGAATSILKSFFGGASGPPPLPEPRFLGEDPNLVLAKPFANWSRASALGQVWPNRMMGLSASASDIGIVVKQVLKDLAVNGKSVGEVEAARAQFGLKVSNVSAFLSSAPYGVIFSKDQHLMDGESAANQKKIARQIGVLVARERRNARFFELLKLAFMHRYVRIINSDWDFISSKGGGEIIARLKKDGVGLYTLAEWESRLRHLIFPLPITNGAGFWVYEPLSRQWLTEHVEGMQSDAEIAALTPLGRIMMRVTDAGGSTSKFSMDNPPNLDKGPDVLWFGDGALLRQALSFGINRNVKWQSWQNVVNYAIHVASGRGSSGWTSGQAQEYFSELKDRLETMNSDSGAVLAGSKAKSVSIGSKPEVLAQALGLKTFAQFGSDQQTGKPKLIGATVVATSAKTAKIVAEAQAVKKKKKKEEVKKAGSVLVPAALAAYWLLKR